MGGNGFLFGLAQRSAFLFLLLCFSFPRSYSLIKIPFAVSFVVLGFFLGFKLSRHVALFYLPLMIIGVVGAGLGIMNDGSSLGAMAAFRLYFLWSCAFVVFFSFMSRMDAFGILDDALVWSGIVLSVFNIVFVLFSAIGLSFIPQSVLESMGSRVGFHGSYIQLTSHNVGMLFFIIPYLICRVYLRKVPGDVMVRHNISLLLCLVVAAISGRRALWIVVSLSPFVVFALAFFFRGRNGINLKDVLLFLSASAVSSVFFLVGYQELGVLDHLASAFSDQDERSIQSGYLIKGFFESPVVGQGFGVHAGYIRSEDAPWTYELTYHQFLFNVGVFGVGAVLSLITFYFINTLVLEKREAGRDVRPLSLLSGLAGIAIGAYSNPYFGSFDFLLLIGVLPLIGARRYVLRDRGGLWVSL